MNCSSSKKSETVTGFLSHYVNSPLKCIFAKASTQYCNIWCYFTYSYYIVIVVPLRNSNQLPKDKIPDDFFKEVRRRRETTKRDIDEPYIAAKFIPSKLPKRFNVGDKNFKNLYGYYNKELTKGSYYTVFTRAYVKNDKGVSKRYC